MLVNEIVSRMTMLEVLTYNPLNVPACFERRKSLEWLYDRDAVVDIFDVVFGGRSSKLVNATKPRFIKIKILGVWPYAQLSIQPRRTITSCSTNNSSVKVWLHVKIRLLDMHLLNTPGRIYLITNVDLNQINQLQLCQEIPDSPCQIYASRQNTRTEVETEVDFT